MYTTRIDDPESGLKLIQDSISRFDAKIFLYAVKYCDNDLERLSRQTDEIAIYRGYLEAEYERLVLAGTDFIGTFATPHNNVFNNADILLNKMKRGIKMTKELYALFCPKQSRKAMQQQRVFGIERSVWGCSYLSSFTTSYTEDMFGFEGYSHVVHGCYVEMQKFFSLLQKCIKYCQDMIKKEKAARQDKDYIEYIYQRQITKILKSIKGVLDAITGVDDTITDTNPLLKGRKAYGDTVTNLQENYHKCDNEQLQQVVAYDYFYSKNTPKYTILERKLFGNDEAMIDKARLVIRNFDSIIPDKSERKKIEASIIAMFVYWCHTDDVKNTVEYFTKQYKGNYSLVGDTAVYKYYRILKELEEEYTNKEGFSYSKFLENIENIIQPITENVPNKLKKESLRKFNSPISIAL